MDTQQTVYGEFHAHFRVETLKNLCIGKDGIQTGPFGSQLHQRDYVPVGTPIITVEHLGENLILHENLPRVSDSDRTRLAKYLLQDGDIVFSRVGSVDRRALVSGAEEGWLFSGRCLRVRPDPSKVDSQYLSYFLGLEVLREYIRSIAVGATMPSLNTRILSDIPIVLPDMSKQRAIAHVLGTLDDKIELNRRMNRTLEEMAQAIFQDWFVDFGPTKAKMEGLDPYLPPELWNLFPDNFVESEIGEIPHTWELKSVSKLLTAKNIRVGETKLPEYSCTNTGLYPRSKYFNKQLSKANSKNKVVHHGDMVFGLSRQILNFGLMKDTIGCVSPAYRVYTIDDNIIEPDLAERMIRTHTEYYYGAIAGSSREGQSISPDALSLLNILCPPITLQETFYAEIEPIAQRRKILEDEAEDLITQRDSLLPKLLSGNLEFSYF